MFYAVYYRERYKNIRGVKNMVRLKGKRLKTPDLNLPTVVLCNWAGQGQKAVVCMKDILT